MTSVKPVEKKKDKLKDKDVEHKKSEKKASKKTVSSKDKKKPSAKDDKKVKKEELWHCPVCYGFEENFNYPLMLGCGHNLCQHCVLQLPLQNFHGMPEQHKACPECRAAIQSFTPNYFVGGQLGLDYLTKYNDLSVIEKELPPDEQKEQRRLQERQEEQRRENLDTLEVVERIQNSESSTFSVFVPPPRSFFHNQHLHSRRNLLTQALNAVTANLDTIHRSSIPTTVQQEGNQQQQENNVIPLQNANAIPTQINAPSVHPPSHPTTSAAGSNSQQQQRRNIDALRLQNAYRATPPSRYSSMSRWAIIALFVFAVLLVYAIAYYVPSGLVNVVLILFAFYLIWASRNS